MERLMPPMARAKKRPVVLELGQLEGRLQSPRLTGAGEPTVGSARARARAKYKVEHVPNKIAPRSASKIRQKRKAMIIFSTYFWEKNCQNYPTVGWCSNSTSHVAPGLNEKSQIWSYLKRDFLRFFRNFERSWNFWVASWNFKSRLKIFNEF